MLTAVVFEITKKLETNQESIYKKIVEHPQKEIVYNS